MAKEKNKFSIYYSIFILFTYIVVSLIVEAVGVEGDYYRRKSNYTAIITGCIHLSLWSLYFIYNMCKIIWGKDEDLDDEDEELDDDNKPD